MCAYKLLVLTILVTFQVVDNKEAGCESCKDFLMLIKKIMKSKTEDDTADSAEVTKKSKTNKFEEKLDKYLENKFAWWPSKLIEDFDVTEAPKTKASPVDALMTSYMDFLTNLFKMF